MTLRKTGNAGLSGQDTLPRNSPNSERINPYRSPIMEGGGPGSAKGGMGHCRVAAPNEQLEGSLRATDPVPETGLSMEETASIRHLRGGREPDAAIS